MAFHRSMTTEQLTVWLLARGLHPDDCSTLEDEKFTGESFLILEKDDLKELGVGLAGRRLLEKLVEEAKNAPVFPSPAKPVTDAKKVTMEDSDDEQGQYTDNELKHDVPYCMDLEDSSDDEGPQGDDDSRAQGAAGAWIQTKKIWGGRTILKVYFLNPSLLDSWLYDDMKVDTANILDWAAEWNAPFYPKFEETDSKKEADIRVEFTESGGCWSKVGMDAHKVKDKSKPTMCLNLKGYVPDFQKSLVIQQFGRSLGLEYEHQRSDFWSVVKKHVDIDKMRADPRLRGGKSKMSKSDFNADWYKNKSGGGKTTDYDQKSIMHSWFDVGWLKNKKYLNVENIEQDPRLSVKEKVILKGIHARHNNFAKKPSKTDLKFLAQAYGGVLTQLIINADEDSDVSGSEDELSENKPLVGTGYEPAPGDEPAIVEDEPVVEDRVLQMSEFERLSYEEVLQLVDNKTVLDVDNAFGTVLDYLNSVTGNWEIICQDLNIEASKIQELVNSFGNNTVGCMWNALMDWLSLKSDHQTHGKPTWRKVAESVVRVNKNLFLSIALEHTAAGVTVVPDTVPLGQTLISNNAAIGHVAESMLESLTVVPGIGPSGHALMSDSATIVPDTIPEPSEQTAMSDSTTIVPDTIPEPSEQTAMSDSTTIVPDTIPEPSEQTAMSDSMTIVPDTIPEPSEQTAISDSTTIVPDTIPEPSEQTAISDSTTIVPDTIPEPSEQTEMTDSATIVPDTIPEPSEQTAMSDSATIVPDTIPEPSEQTAMSDSTTIVPDTIPEPSEQTAISDSTTIVPDTIPEPSEQTEMTDSATIVPDTIPEPSEQTAMSDSATIVPDTIPEPSEQTAMSDSTTIVPDSIPEPSEQTAMSDSTTIIPDTNPEPSEQTAMSDSTTIVPDTIPEPSEQTAISDSMTIVSDTIPEPSEQTVMSDIAVLKPEAESAKIISELKQTSTVMKRRTTAVAQVPRPVAAEKVPADKEKHNVRTVADSAPVKQAVVSKKPVVGVPSSDSEDDSSTEEEESSEEDTEQKSTDRKKRLDRRIKDEPHQRVKVLKKSEFDKLGNEKILELVDDVKILDEDDDSGDVMGYLRTAAGDWQTICKSLHVKASRIREFSNNYGHDSARCMDSAVADWLSLNYNIEKFGAPTWRKVAQSVVRVNKKLFLSIASEHTVGGLKVVPDSAPVKQSVGGKKPVARAPSSDLEEDARKKKRKNSGIVLNVNTHLRHVKNALLEAASQWRDIGQALDITPGTLKSIRGGDSECLNEMLTKWMHGGEATMDQLLEALKDPSVQRGDIVQQIKALKRDKRSRVGLA